MHKQQETSYIVKGTGYCDGCEVLRVKLLTLLFFRGVFVLSARWAKLATCKYLSTREMVHVKRWLWSVGIGGSGRQSATKLAANMCSSILFQIEITKHYTTVEWRDDIKKVMYSFYCGVFQCFDTVGWELGKASGL